MSKSIIDVMVVGLGGHGSAAVAHLAKRTSKRTSFKVVGLDQFNPVHENGR